MYDPYNCQTLEEFHGHIFPEDEDDSLELSDEE